MTPETLLLPGNATEFTHTDNHVLGGHATLNHPRFAKSTNFKRLIDARFTLQGMTSLQETPRNSQLLCTSWENHLYFQHFMSVKFRP